MRTTLVERVAAVLLGLEGLGLLLIVGWEIAALVSGDAGLLPTSLALIVLTTIGAAAVLGFGIATWRGASWGRSGGIVAQLLILAVALGAATGSYGQPILAVQLAVPAVIVLVCLVLGVRAAGRRREPAADGAR
ncbi:histidine kinase [Microbacterium invictum]|uniref:Uncharacterized protein n=1 Tax=Microbacterium invictum TaxID=515415 RepID=A0AA40SP67_9MICO|nr:histidine kinase [Microbacterium invictum]MBB4139707.1 hypothetical protein [Microbacterium invictum]